MDNNEQHKLELPNLTLTVFEDSGLVYIVYWVPTTLSPADVCVTVLFLLLMRLFEHTNVGVGVWSTVSKIKSMVDNVCFLVFVKFTQHRCC